MATTWDNYDEFERARLIEEGNYYSVKYVCFIIGVLEEAELLSSVVPSVTGSATGSKLASRAVSKQTNRHSLHSSRAPSVMDKTQSVQPGESVQHMCEFEYYLSN